MASLTAKTDMKYILAFDGGGTKTECLLANGQGEILARALAGPSNPLRTGYMRAWFSLSEAADAVLRRTKLKAGDISAVCAGIGGVGRAGVAKRVATFFERSFPNAAVRVTTDLEIAFEAAFGTGEGILLLAGTGSAAFGRDASGRTARAGGRGPWFSDEGSAFDIGRRAFAAISRAEEHRGPETALTKRIFSWHQTQNWEWLYDRISKNADDVFPQTFPLVAQLADKEDAVAREILSSAAQSLAELAAVVARELGWRDREISMAKAGGVHGRSHFFDKAIDAELQRVLPKAILTAIEISPAEAAVKMALRGSVAKGNAA
jgi:N-acetylglucosamine kinase-like BadF-type ATPase